MTDKALARLVYFYERERAESARREAAYAKYPRLNHAGFSKHGFYDANRAKD